MPLLVSPSWCDCKGGLRSAQWGIITFFEFLQHCFYFYLPTITCSISSITVSSSIGGFLFLISLSDLNTSIPRRILLWSFTSDQGSCIDWVTSIYPGICVTLLNHNDFSSLRWTVGWFPRRLKVERSPLKEGWKSTLVSYLPSLIPHHRPPRRALELNRSL